MDTGVRLKDTESSKPLSVGWLDSISYNRQTPNGQGVLTVGQDRRGTRLVLLPITVRCG